MWFSSMLDMLGYTTSSDPGTPQTTPQPEVSVVVNEPGGSVVLTRRKTDLSKRVKVEVWASAQTLLVVNGQVISS